MKYEEGIWFPDGEDHLVDMVRKSSRIGGRGTYQYHKLEAALQYVRHRRCALDIGMHVGLWAMHLVKRFDFVVGFEPVEDHIKCLSANMAGVTNYQVHHCALGDHTGSVGLKFMPGSTGSTQVVEGGHGVSLRQLDEFVFKVIDFIKIDVEGYEWHVVTGGEQLIRKHRPVIILEQKGIKKRVNSFKFDYGKKQYDARDLLRSWGARQLFEIHGDCCLAW